MPVLAADLSPEYSQAKDAYALKDWGKALKLFRRAESVDSKAALPVWGEANCLYQQGKKGESLAAYRRASALAPESVKLQQRVQGVEKELAAAPDKDAGATLGRFGLGIGYPDMRARLNLWRSLDIEAKLAFATGEQAYSGRLFASPLGLGPLNLQLGAEAGYLRFDGVNSISGDGFFAEPFVGFELGFARRWRVNADIGPSWISIASQGYSLAEVQWTYNTAIYFFLY